MGIKIDNKLLKAGMLVDLTGAKKTIKKIGICTSGTEVKQVWPDDPILNLSPTLMMPLNGDTLDYSGNKYNPIGSEGSPAYTKGIDGRKALMCSSQFAIALNPIAKVVGPFTISVLINPQVVRQETTRNGLLGGVISGNNNLGLGYALAARVNGDLDEGFQFQQYPKNPVNPNIAASTCVSNNQWEQTLNVWMHLLLEFDSTLEGRGMYLNGYRHGVSTDTAQRGNVNYSDRDRGWDGNIYLGRCFQTTGTPKDYWCGYIQDFILWDRKLTNEEKKIVLNRYVGNMVGSLVNGFLPINSLKNNGVFICSGGTISPGVLPNRFDCEDNRVKPNGTKATTIEVDLDTITTTYYYFYVNRSLDSSIRGGGETGYTFLVNNIEYIHTFGNLGRLNFNIDGSGTILGIPREILKVGTNTIVVNLPGFDSPQSITLNATLSYKAYTMGLRISGMGSLSTTAILNNWVFARMRVALVDGTQLDFFNQNTVGSLLNGSTITLTQNKPAIEAIEIVFNCKNPVPSSSGLLAGCLTPLATWQTGYPTMCLLNKRQSPSSFMMALVVPDPRAWETFNKEQILLCLNLVDAYTSTGKEYYQGMMSSPTMDSGGFYDDGD